MSDANDDQPVSHVKHLREIGRRSLPVVSVSRIQEPQVAGTDVESR